MSLHDIPPDTPSDAARAYLESLRWHGGQALCPSCGKAGSAARVAAVRRPGLWQCRRCRRQFTVTAGTLFEDTKLPLDVWLRAIGLVCSSPYGVTAQTLKSELRINYRSAWTILEKLRYALTQPPLAREWRRASARAK